jgi:hypothetical protein
MTDLDRTVYGPRYLDALTWAAQLHAGQGRKAGPGEPVTIPYVAHLLEVSSLVWLGGGDEDQAIAGLLHDAVEDAGVRAAEIAARYGDRVADLVVACTDGTPDGARDSSSWLDRKLDYLLALYADDHADALLVTAADKVSNARAIVDDLIAAGGDAVAVGRFWSRFNAAPEAIAWYYVEVLTAVATCQPGNGLLPRLEPLVALILDAAGGIDPFAVRHTEPDDDAMARAERGLDDLALAKRAVLAAR